MDAQQFTSQLDALIGQLRGRDPNPATPWVSESRLIEWLVETCTWLLDASVHLEEICEDQDTAAHMRELTLDRCAAGAALLIAAGRMGPAKKVLERCAELSADSSAIQLYTAALAKPEDFARAIRAGWLWSATKYDEARELAGRLAQGSGPIAKYAAVIAEAPTPITSAPELFTLNGFGVRLYGSEHHRNDGSYTSVRYATALFIPVFPIDAYRVRDEGDGYRFLGKVELSTTLKAWKYGMLSALGGLMLWGMGSAMLNAPHRVLDKAVDEVASYEADDPKAALERYEELLATYDEEITEDRHFEDLAEGWVRSAVALAELPTPLVPESVDQALGVVVRHDALPARMQGERLAEPLVEQLLSWAGELGADSPEAADASLELYTAAGRYPSEEHAAEIAAGVREVRMSLAGQLAADWPLEALRQYAQLVDDEPEAIARMSELLGSLPESPTLLADISGVVEIWAGKVDGATSAPIVALTEQGLALAKDSERAVLLSSGDKQALLDAVELAPTDQGLIVRLAELERQPETLDAAASRLAQLGKPGLMTHDAQYLLASIEFERGQLDAAAGLLEQMLRSRLPAFEDARRAYDRELDALQEKLIAQLEQGDFPPAHSAGLQSSDPMQARAAFSAWMDEKVAASSELARLQDSYARQSDIVPVAILLGSVQLQRARSREGAEREQLLDAAEHAFLAIRGEAQGMPSYHLSLGQVYYRLGKDEEGQAEFQVLLDNPDPGVHLLVAQGYRDLGQFDQATATAAGVYELAGRSSAVEGQLDPALVKHQAAVLSYLLADTIEDRRLWLGRADQNDEFVVTSLLELEGDELRHAGDYAAADEKYAAAYELYRAQAERGDGNFNNAAINLLQRYACTGKLSHVEEAVKLMQRAHALNPDNGVVVGNYASILDFGAQLELLDTFVPVKQLRLSQGEVSQVLGLLARSASADKLASAARASRGRQRVLDTHAQHEVLSPQAVMAYAGQLKWHTFTADLAALEKLEGRLRSVEGLDTATALRAKHERIEGTHDERVMQDLALGLEDRAQLRETLARPSDATLAVLAQLDGDALFERARLGWGPEARDDARAAIEAFEQAQRLWPQGISAEQLADALLFVAVAELGVQDMELTKTWYASLRADGMALTLAELRTQGAPLIAKLPGQADFERSMALRRELPVPSLSPLDVIAARIAADAELEARALAQSRSPFNMKLGEIAALMLPDDTFERMLALLEG